MYDDGRWMRSLDETATQQNGFGQGFRYVVGVVVAVAITSPMCMVHTYKMGNGQHCVHLQHNHPPEYGPRITREAFNPRITVDGGLQLRTIATAADSTRCVWFCTWLYTQVHEIAHNHAPRPVYKCVVTCIAKGCAHVFHTHHVFFLHPPSQ